MDYIFSQLNQSFEDQLEYLIDNKEFGKFWRNSIFVENNLNNIPLQPLRPQTLAGYGFITFDMSNLEAADGVMLTSFISAEYNNSSLIITIYDYESSHFIFHIFDRKRSKINYQIKFIDYVIECKITNNELTVKSNQNNIESSSL